MTETSKAIVINRDRAAIWTALADFGAISAWAPNVDHSCLMTEQLADVGATRRIQSGRATVVETIVEWQPDYRLAYEITGLPPAIRSVRNTWQLDEIAEGTKVSIISAVEPGARPPHKAVAAVVGKVLAKASQQMLDGLRDHLQKAVV